MYHTGEQGGVQ